MRLVIDLQGAQSESRFRGIGRYALAITKAIARLNTEHEIFVVLNGMLTETLELLRTSLSALLPNDHILVWQGPGPTRFIDGTNHFNQQIAQRLREAFILSLSPDMILITSLFEGYGDEANVSIGSFDHQTPTAVILYDLIPLISTEKQFTENQLLVEYYQAQLASLKKANVLLAISESARQEAIQYLPVAPDQVVTIYGSGDSIFRPLQYSVDEKQIFCLNLGINKPFLFYTGGADERKNLPRLIRAFASLTPELRKQYQLVFAGKMPQVNQNELQKIARQAGLSKQDFLLLGYVTDEQLVSLFNCCALFVFPSLHEGLGIPPLEAMACGAPVIGANTTSLPEVIGLPEAMFNPRDEQAISKLITRALTDELFRNQLRENGAKQIQKFTWEDSAKRLLLALEQFHQNQLENGAKPKSVNADTINNALIHSIVNIEGFKASPYIKLQLAQLITHNQPPGAIKKLFIDVSELIERDARTGIQRVVKSVLNEAFDNPPKQYEVIPVYANNMEPGYRVATKLLNQFKGIHTPCHQDRMIDFNCGDVFLGLDLAAHIIFYQKPYFEKMRQKGAIVKFVVYDLLPISHARFFPKGTNALFKKWLEVVKENHEAICISQSTAKELKNYYQAIEKDPQKIPKISYFLLGSDFSSSRKANLNSIPDRAFFAPAIFSLPTFLMVGTLEPRKGHLQVLEAFEQWWQEGSQAILVIAGKLGWDMDQVATKIKHHPQYNHLLYWYEKIDDDHLQQAYQNSTCLIMASEGEGFGLPLIEAAYYQLPILSRDLPIFREIAGNYAQYFCANSGFDLKVDLINWLDRFQNQTHAQSVGMPHLSWQESTAQLLSVTCPMPDQTNKTATNE
jgi:glycosyltransferase involved in cell wall biosynthesis